MDVREIAIVGGGIAGLAAAHRLVTHAPEGSVRVTVLEAGERFGGWIRTEEFAGRPVDFGPDSLLVRTPWAVELCRELGIEDQLVAPGEGGSRILRDGKLRVLPPGILAGLPNGPWPFVRSGLLSPLGIARAGLDLILPAKRTKVRGGSPTTNLGESAAPGAPAKRTKVRGGPPTTNLDGLPDADESIGALIRRRLGNETLERVIDPLLGGVHAGRCDDLSLAATAPQIAAAARADRSLLRGLRKTAPPRPPADAPPAPVFMAPAQGMQTLVDALLAALDGRADLRTGAAVSALAPEPIAAKGGAPTNTLDASPEAAGAEQRTAVQEGSPTTNPDAPPGVVVHVAGEEPRRFDGAILAVPGPVAASLLAAHTPGAARTLAELEYASVSHNAFAYDPAQLPDLPPGTGFLVPRPEGTLMTACTFLDQKWPQRTANGAGDGTFVIKCSAGRIDDPRFLSMSDEELTATIHGELVALLGIRGEPQATRTVRVRGGLPQYRPGHIQRIEQATAEVAAALPGVSLAGAAYRGASVPVCIREGRAAADAQLTAH